MKQTNFFDISVPELGDRPDITQVSNAISNLEDALAGTMEYMNASINNRVLTLTSATRTTNRTGYHTGLTCVFTSGAKIDAGGITSIIVDNLHAMPAELKFIIDVDDSAIVTFDGTQFAFKHAPIPRSNAIDSSSEHFVATSRAVKTLNDNKAEKTIQIVAGNGLTGGGDLTSNKAINVVSADAGIVVNADNIKLNVVNAINSTDAIRPASANSAKTAYDRGTEGLNKANEAISLANSNNTAMDNKKVNRAGDTMTGRLTVKEVQLTNHAVGILNNAGNNMVRGSSNDPGITVVGNTEGLTYIDSSANPRARIGANDYTIYHTGNKPTKTDVGLSNVSNFPITSSVSDASNEKYATAGAVKQAYDRASSGINEANTKVSKSGDTMTGTLTVPSFVSTGNYGLCFDDNTSDTKAFIRAKRKDSSEQNWVFGMHNATKRFELVGGQLSDWYLSIGGTHVTAAKFLGPLQGNADTSTSSTKLTTARQINGTNFDGTANITTSKWGTARSVKVGNTAKNIDGSGNIEWTMSEIGAVERRRIGNFTLGGDSPVAGKENTFTVTIPLASNSIGYLDIEVDIYGTWSHADISGTETIRFSFLASGASPALQSKRIAPVSNSTAGRYFTYGNFVRDNNGVHFDVHFNGSNSPLEVYATYKGGTFGLFSGVTAGKIKRGNALTRYDVYSTNFKPTASDVGALSKSGGTMTGAIQMGSHNINFTASDTGDITFNESGGTRKALLYSPAATGQNFAIVAGATLTVNTTGVISSSNITAYSDIKLKEDLEVIPDALDKIDKLNGYTYTRKDSGERQTGVVAQEVQAILPEVIVSNKDEKGEETLSVAYGNMVGLLIEGIKELRAEVEELKAKLEEVK